jgi:hypothetical protein
MITNPAHGRSDAVPRNDLEALLLEMQAGGLEPETFAKRLLDQQVFMPVKDERHKIAGFQASTRAEPLVVEDEDGNRILVLFSVPERAKDFLANYPGHSGGLVTEFSWVLRRMAQDLGIAINPGDSPGMDMDPEMVAMLAALLPEQAQ